MIVGGYVGNSVGFSVDCDETMGGFVDHSVGQDERAVIQCVGGTEGGVGAVEI